MIHSKGARNGHIDKALVYLSRISMLRGGGILITRDIIISSIVAYGNWILPICEGCYPLFSKQDEQNVFTLDVFEQLIIIAVACHYLKVLPFYQPTVSAEELLDVKSFIKDEETGVLSINPSILPPRKAESFLLKSKK